VFFNFEGETMETTKAKILVVGKNGKLGSRLLSRMANSRRFRKQFDVLAASREDNLPALIKDASVVILAVKPGQLDGLPGSTGIKLGQNQLLISLVTGTSGSSLQSMFETTAIICATTNIGVEIGKGSTVCCAPFRLSSQHKWLAHALFSNWGKVHWQKTEDALPGSVIATGCMPAIHVLDIQQSIQACVSFGMQERLARELVLNALEATLALYRRGKPGLALKAITKGVTTPGGITEQILAQLSLSNESKTAAFAQALGRIMALRK
jgi:pyrroline-5-carboxylate reductase